MDIPRDAETLIMVMAMNHGHISCQGHYANFFGDCIKVPEKKVRVVYENSCGQSCILHWGKQKSAQIRLYIISKIKL